MPRFGQRIRELRKAKGWTLRDVAQTALLGHTTIGMTRHDARVSEANAIKAAKAAPSL